MEEPKYCGKPICEVLAYTFTDGCRLTGASKTVSMDDADEESTTGMLDIMNRLQRGAADVAFLGGAVVDRYGKLNTTQIRTEDGEIRLPGSGGACDIACLADRTVLVLPHEPRRFVEQVDYVTSPGHAAGAEQSRPAPGGGPSSLVTSKATVGFDDRGELTLESVHPGESVE
jgi:glutaconate CoA-transferase subunit B